MECNQFPAGYAAFLSLNRTRLLTIPHHVDVVWSEPVIVHFRRAEDVGHFAVLLRSSGTTVVLWDGLNGTVELSQRTFRERRSDVVLLTSTMRITHPEHAVRVGTLSTLQVRFVAALVATVCAGGVLYPVVRAYYKRREKSCNVHSYLFSVPSPAEGLVAGVVGCG